MANFIINKEQYQKILTEHIMSRREYEEYRKENYDDSFEYNYFMPRHTGLDVEIALDSYESYKHFNHPLWLYFRNGYDRNNILLPLSISGNPTILVKGYKLNISNKSLRQLKSFVRKYYAYFVDYANRRISDKDIDNIICNQSINESKGLIIEMATFYPKETGLPMEIWVDQGTDPQHGPRIKFKASNEQRTTREFSTMTISDRPEILNMPTKTNLKKRDLEQLRSFVIYNKELLLSAAEFSLRKETEILPYLIRLGKNGGPLYPAKLFEPLIMSK